jgi:hypothetical protein
VFCLSSVTPQTLNERFFPCLSSFSLLCPLTLLFLLLVFLVDQRDEPVTENRKDKGISAANVVTGFNPPMDFPSIEDSRNEPIATPGKMVQAAAASVIGFSRLSVEPPFAVAVAEQELQAATPAVCCFRPALMIQILKNPLLPPRAPPPAAEANEIPVGMVSQGTLDRGQRTQTRTISRPTSSLSLSLWLLFLFSSSVHGITLNCINKNTPSSSCCYGEITLDPTMTNIAANAFDGCSGLNGSLIIPSSVTTIGNGAFYNCKGFTGSLTLPSSVTTISTYAFAYCSGFTGSLTLPSSVTTIGTYAFFACSGFTGSLTLPSSVTTIGTYTFRGCSGFTGSLTLPSSLTTIGNSAFQDCSGLTGSLTLPSSATTIGNYAFYNCKGFTGSLTLPSSVTTIGDNAFAGCSGLTSAVTFPNSATTLGTTPFASNKCNWLSCCSSCTLTGAQICLCASPSCSGFCATSFPSSLPSSPPSFAPSALPSAAHLIVFGFGVKFGDDGVLKSGKAILVDYLGDAKRGDTLPPLPLSLLTLSSHILLLLSGKMIPISRIVNASRVSSASDPPLPSDCILIKWRPVSAVSGIGSWEPNSHMILSIPTGGVLVSWLVSLLSEEIKGFIVKGDLSPSLSSLPSLHHHRLLLLVLVQILCPPPISFTSSNIPTPPLLCPSRSPSLPTRPSCLRPSENMFLECLTNASISSTQDYSSFFLGQIR